MLLPLASWGFTDAGPLDWFPGRAVLFVLYGLCAVAGPAVLAIDNPTPRPDQPRAGLERVAFLASGVGFMVLMLNIAWSSAIRPVAGSIGAGVAVVGALAGLRLLYAHENPRAGLVAVTIAVLVASGVVATGLAFGRFLS